MKNPLVFFKSLFFWSLIGIVGLLLLIWFIGPEVAISGFKPLASAKIRITVCISIITIWLGKIVFRHWREARRNALLLKEIKASQEPILKKSADETVMARQFAEIDKVVKNAKFSKTKLSWLDSGQYLYQMPWYVVLGAAGSGKTTILRQSGLNFPLESTLGSSVSGLAGTRDCDWFLTDEAVLLDTAGRLSLHDKQYGQKDIQDWQEFVALLKRYRPKQPINGLIVTVGVDDLFGNQSNLLDLAAELKKRIHEMRTQFGIDFPVYLTITKLDLLHGFNSFFSHLTEEERNQYFGIPFHDISTCDEYEEPIHFAKHTLEKIAERFRSLSLAIVSNLEVSSDRVAAFIFPDEFDQLSQALLKFLRELSKSSKFEEAVQWRGVYFSSAIQKDHDYIFIGEDLYKDFQLTQKYTETERTKDLSNNQPFSFFLNKMFTDVIFNEASLASENKSWFTKYQTIYWSSLTAIISTGIVIVVFMLISYFNNSTYLAEVERNAVNLSNNIKSAKELSFKQAIDFANRVQDVVKSSNIPDLNAPPMSYRMGLYQGEQMQQLGQSVYNRLLNDSAMPLISRNLDELLRSDKRGDREFTYNSLKAYLMMFQKEHFDKDFMRQWLVTNLFDGDQSVDGVQKTAADKALQQVLSQENLIFSVPYDENLVEKRRQELARTDIASIILEQTLQSAVYNRKDEFKPVSFSSMGGAQSHLLFRRKSGSALKEPIDPAYTKEVYLRAILPSLVKNTDLLFKEAMWVLGEYATYTGQNETAVQEEVQRLYFQQYIRVWNNYITDLTLVAPSGARESVQIAKLLSDKNSPLVSMIRGISENTTLSVTTQLQAEENNFVKEWLSKSGIDVNKLVAGLSRQEDTVDANKQLFSLLQNTPVDDAFADFHVLLRSEKDQPPTINGVIEAINDLYIYLVAVNVSVEKGVDLPPDDPFIKYKAEVGRLPSPFREMLDNFSTVILEKTDRVVDEKLMSSLATQLAPLAQQCEAVVNQGYPFQSHSSNDVTLESFAQVFGENGIYQKFSQLAGPAASLAKTDSLDTLMAKNTSFANRFSAMNTIQAIRQTYFSKSSDSPQFDFTIKVVFLDPELESVRISYDGKSQTYSHGPVTPMALSWPSKSENPQIQIEVTSPSINTVGINTTGIWSVFRLIEKGQITRQTDSATAVVYKIRGKTIILEFSASSPYNPFNLNRLRGFHCVK